MFGGVIAGHSQVITNLLAMTRSVLDSKANHCGRGYTSFSVLVAMQLLLFQLLGDVHVNLTGLQYKRKIQASTETGQII